MIQNTRNVILLPSQTISANGTTGAIGIPDIYNACILYLNVGTATGTLPTLDVWIQQGFKAIAAGDTAAGTDMAATTYTVWDDYIHFAQVTAGPGVQIARILEGSGLQTTVTATASIGAAQDATGAGATAVVKAGPIGSAWRIKWVVGGTTPSYPTVYLLGQFLPVGS